MIEKKEYYKKEWYFQSVIFVCNRTKWFTKILFTKKNILSLFVISFQGKLLRNIYSFCKMNNFWIICQMIFKKGQNNQCQLGTYNYILYTILYYKMKSYIKESWIPVCWFPEWLYWFPDWFMWLWWIPVWMCWLTARSLPWQFEVVSSA